MEEGSRVNWSSTSTLYPLLGGYGLSFIKCKASAYPVDVPLKGGNFAMCIQN